MQIISYPSENKILILTDEYEHEIIQKIKKETAENFPLINIELKKTNNFIKTKTGKLKFVINGDSLNE